MQKSTRDDSIRVKIMLRMSTTVLIATLIIGIITTVMNYISTMSLIEQTMTETAQIAAERVEQELLVYSKIAYEVGCSPKLASGAVSARDKQKFIDQHAAAHDLQRGNVLDVNGKSIFDGKDYSDREYFKASIKGDTCVSEPLVSKVTGEFTVIISAPIWENGVPDSSVVGVVYFVPSSTFLNDIVNSIKISKGGSAYILNGSGTTIAHRNMENVTSEENTIQDAKTDSSLKQLASIEKKMINGESGYSSYTYKGEKKLLAYAPIEGTNSWSIGVNAPTMDFLGSTILSIVITVIIIIITLCIATVITRNLATSIGEPLMRCTERFEKLAEGDLHSPMPELNSNDEVGKLVKASTMMKKDITDVISDIKYILNEMAEGNFTVRTQNAGFYKGDYEEIIIALRNLRDIMSSTLLQINRSAEQVATGSDQLAQNAQSLAGAASEQASAVEELTAIIVDVNELSEKNATDAEAAYYRMREAEKEADKSQENLKELTDAMTGIRETSLKIQDIIASIEDIASQTNLLSLNASIEAARAGEAGRGFAVVADQIGKLASDSARSAVDTRQMIEKSMEEIKAGSNIAEKTVEAIKSVLISMSDFQTVSKGTSEISRKQADMLQQIQQGIEQISLTVQSNSASAEETSATSEELSAQAENLKEQVSRFDLLNS